MNVLILGSGGREATFAWKLNQSPLIDQLYITPGNGGTSNYAQHLAISMDDFQGLAIECLKRNIEYIVVGPEAPLVDGVYDFFRSHKEYSHIHVIGPSKNGAQLEGSKAFAKKFMADYHIPTAAYIEVTKDNVQEGLNHINQSEGPYVLKADGLAAGKGVLIIEDKEEAKKELEAMIEGKFGSASSKVVIEAFLDGIEFSVFVLTDGKEYVLLPEAKDYKRIGEGNTGLNTGGMGAISPVPLFDEPMKEKVIQRIIEPTIKGIQDRGIDYHGFIFFGLIEVKGEPMVIEYNCRMGDPETEAVIPRLKDDLMELILEVAKGGLSSRTCSFEEQTAATIMLVSGGYPEAYEKNKEISGLHDCEGSLIFHAGTKSTDGKIYTNGGRVIAVTSFGESIDQACAQSKKNADKITFQGKYYRRDIGFDLV